MRRLQILHLYQLQTTLNQAYFRQTLAHKVLYRQSKSRIHKRIRELTFLEMFLSSLVCRWLLRLVCALSSNPSRRDSV